MEDEEKDGLREIKYVKKGANKGKEEKAEAKEGAMAAGMFNLVDADEWKGVSGDKNGDKNDGHAVDDHAHQNTHQQDGKQKRQREKRSGGRMLSGCFSKKNAFRIGKAAALLAAFYLGGKVYGPAVDYTTNTAMIAESSARGKTAEYLRSGLRSLTGNNIISVTTDHDAVAYVSRLAEQGKIRQEDATALYALIRGKADPKRVNSDSAATVYSLILEGKIKKEGLEYLRKAIDVMLPPEKIIPRDPAYLQDGGTAGQPGTVNDAKIDALLQQYRSLSPEQQREFIIYGMTMMASADERDRAIMASVPQMSEEAKARAAMGIVEGMIQKYSPTIDEKCGINPLCGILLEKAFAHRDDLEKSIADEFDRFGSYGPNQ